MDEAGPIQPEFRSRHQPVIKIAQAIEVHRLAVAGRESAIARHVGRLVAERWLPTSRFADVAALANATLTLGPDADAFHDRGWARTLTSRQTPPSSNRSAKSDRPDRPQ